MSGDRIAGPERRTDAGFGLIEVVVALLILSVGILSVSNVLTQSVSMQTIAAQRTSALSIAQTSMEQIRATDPLLITAQAEVSVNEDGTPDVNGVFTREVTMTAVSGNINEVTVIVTAPRSSPVRLVVWVYDGAT